MPQAQGYGGNNGNRQKINMTGTEWSTERWVVIIMLFIVGSLILIRRGFRGVGVPLTNVKVGATR